MIHAATIFLSSFLLFLVQPIIAKQILPWFGGSAAVWTTCLVFFQTAGSKASHVGIAIDETSFVHAPNSRGVVRVDRLDGAYWSSRFLGARRVF